MLGSGGDVREKRKELKITEPFPLILCIYLTIFWVFTAYESLSSVPWSVKGGADGERAQFYMGELSMLKEDMGQDQWEACVRKVECVQISVCHHFI